MAHEAAAAALLAAAEQLLVDADRLRHDRRTRTNADFVTRRALAYAAAAGYLNQLEQKMTAEVLTTVTPEIRRDPRYGRPYVQPPGGGKEVTYQRCTTFIKALEDTYNLTQWQKRMVAKGLSLRPDYLLAVATTELDDKDKLNELCEQAMEAAKATSARTTGSAVHTLTEYHDRGLEIPVVPDSALADLAAYKQTTAGIEWLHIEAGVVLDELKVHGTPDRIGRWPGERPRVFDVKTGDIEWGIATIAMQMAVYAHGVLYDHTTKTRLPLPDDLDLEQAVIIHLPAGQARCELVDVDIAAGWEGVQLATLVHAWRKRKNLAAPHAHGPDLFGLIGLAGDPDSVRHLWALHQDQWTDQHTAAAKARIDSLTAVAS
jgi:hypothetical protein